MPERIEWLDDGTAGGSPYSPRFGDRYRSELGGLEQAREVFLGGCGLPVAWAGSAPSRRRRPLTSSAIRASSTARFSGESMAQVQD